MSSYTLSNKQMKNTFSLQQISRTSNLDASLLSRQYKLNLMVDFVRVKYENTKLKQSEIANKLGLSSSTLQRYRNDINILSPCKIHPNNTDKRTKQVKNTNFDNNSHREHHLERRQKTSNEFKRPQAISNENSKKVKTKIILKGGFIQGNVEINDQCLGENPQNNKFYRELAMQNISNDKTVRNDTI